jgi:predicted transposase YdaD
MVDSYVAEPWSDAARRLIKANLQRFTPLVKRWEISADEIIETGLEGLLPLLPLTKEGKRRETIDRMIEEIITSGQVELLALGQLFAGLVFKDEADREWLKRRFAVYKDVLEESWVYQEILEKGVEKGLEASRQTLMAIVQGRFPKMVGLTRKLMGDVTDLETLQRLIVSVSLAQNMQEAQQSLVEVCMKQTENQ